MKRSDGWARMLRDHGQDSRKENGRGLREGTGIETGLVHTHTHAHINTHTPKHVYTYTPWYTHTHIHTYSCTCTFMHQRTHTTTFPYGYAQTHTQTQTQLDLRHTVKDYVNALLNPKRQPIDVLSEGSWNDAVPMLYAMFSFFEALSLLKEQDCVKKERDFIVLQQCSKVRWINLPESR